MPASEMPRLTAHTRVVGPEENATTACAQLTTQASPLNSPDRVCLTATGPNAMHEAAPPVRANTSLATGRRALRIPAFCEAYSIGRTTAYRLFKDGDLKVHKVGRVTLIDADEAERWWRSCAKGQQ